MKFNAQRLRVLQNAMASTETAFRLNQTWQAIHDEYNIGLIRGQHIELTAKDKQELRAVVRESQAVDLLAMAPQRFADMDREQVLQWANDEKLAGQAVKRQRLALKLLPGRTLNVNGQAYTLPGSGHWDVALDSIASIEHDGLCIVENYRCFDRLHCLTLEAAFLQSNLLVVYRGDNQYQADTVLALSEQMAVPVWVMGDIDPKGLSLAQAYPRFAGLIAPEWTVLADYFQNPEKRNPTLYAEQLAGCRQALAHTRFSIIKSCWDLIKQYQAGVVQEHWLTDAVTLGLQPAD